MPIQMNFHTSTHFLDLKIPYIFFYAYHKHIYNGRNIKNKINKNQYTYDNHQVQH